MAYSYVTGPDSASWYPSGSSVYRHINARLYYQITETATTYKIDVYGQESLYKDNCGCTVNGILALTGQSNTTGSKVYTYSSSKSNSTGVYYTICATKSVTITKTHAAQTATASMRAERSSSASTYNSTASKTFSIPAKTSYKVTYNANGGTNGSVTSSTKWHDEALTLTTTGLPTRTGYTFAGWYTAASGGTKVTSYTTNAATTFYAHWTANTYSVAFNANGGSGTMSNESFTYDTEKALTANAFTRTDYIFTGWATTATGNAVYTDKQSVKNIAGSGTVTLYATWRYKYTSPNIQAVTALRTTTAGAEDDSGLAGKVVAAVMPGQQETSLNTFSNISTTVTAKYRLMGSTGSYTQIGSAQTLTAAKTLTFQQTTEVFQDTQAYEILVTAEVKVSNATKASSTVSTYISKAEFSVDIDEEGDSIGVFTVAPGTYLDSNNKEVKAAYINGDIVLILDDTAASGVDYEIIQALNTLGWDVSV